MDHDNDLPSYLETVKDRKITLQVPCPEDGGDLVGKVDSSTGFTYGIRCDNVFCDYKQED